MTDVSRNKRAVIIGAGPAGLTAAFELLTRTDIKPIVYEASDAIGGISQTINYKGNRMDIGGHRFFSKSDRVMDWWTSLIPIESEQGQNEFAIRYQNQQRTISVAGKKSGRQRAGIAVADDPDCVLLVLDGCDHVIGSCARIIPAIWAGVSTVRHWPARPSRKNAFAVAGRSLKPFSASWRNISANEDLVMAALS